MKVIDLLQSSQNSRKKDSFSSVSCDVGPGIFLTLRISGLKDVSGVSKAPDIFRSTDHEGCSP